MKSETTGREIGMQPHQTEAAPTVTAPLGCAHSGKLRPDGTGRVRRAPGGLLDGAATSFGWARWQQPFNSEETSAVSEVAIFAPSWTRSWRAELLRAAWLAPPRSARQHRSAADLTPAQLLLVAIPFVPLVVIWGPHLRGTVTVLAPLAVAWVTPMMLWMVARAATRRRLLIVMGRGPQASALHRVLASTQQLAARQHAELLPRGVGKTPGVEKAVQRSQEMAWQAALLVREHTCSVYVDEQLAQLEASASALAESTLAAAQLLPRPWGRTPSDLPCDYGELGPVP